MYCWYIRCFIDDDISIPRHAKIGIIFNESLREGNKPRTAPLIDFTAITRDIMAFNSSIPRASISFLSRRAISISSLLLVLAVVLSAESAFGFTSTNTNSQTSFNYCASSSAVKCRLPIIQQPFTESRIPNIALIRTRQSSMSSITALNSQSLPSDETLSSLQQIAIKASKLAGEIILGNADGADVLKTKDSTRDLLTLIDPLCEKVSCYEKSVCDGYGV